MRYIKSRKGNVGLLILLAAIFALNGLLALFHSDAAGNNSESIMHAKSQMMMAGRSEDTLPK